MRLPAAVGEYRRAELRSPDPMANPYLAFTLMIQAGLHGILNQQTLPQPANLNLYQADAETLMRFRCLPQSLSLARAAAAGSGFIRSSLPRQLLEGYCNF